MSAKVLIVDPSTPGLSQLKDACQDDVLFVTYVAPQHFEEGEEDVEHLHDSQPIPTDLKELCKDATNVGFVWSNPDMQSIPFADFEEMLHDNLVVDLITCDLGKDDFPDRMQGLEALHNNLQIRYSLDKTANPEQGGDWIMESHNASVKPVFFTDDLSLYEHSLEMVVIRVNYRSGFGTYKIKSNVNNIAYAEQFDINGTPVGNSNILDHSSPNNPANDGNVLCESIEFVGDVNWPYNWVLKMDEPALVFGTTYTAADLVISGAAGNKITICEAGNSNVAATAYTDTTYGGMIRNGYSTNNIQGQGGTITGLNVVCEKVGLAYGGGIVQKDANYNQTTNVLKIEKCTFEGHVSGSNVGGICGYKAGYNGLCVVTECSVTGNVSGNGAGGICGFRAGYNGSCEITECDISGNLNYRAGGICGAEAGCNEGSCVVTQCSLFGNISGTEVGGICGFSAGYKGLCVVTECSMNGNIETAASGSGGICGPYAANDGSCLITQCSMTGNVAAHQAGGIYGKNAGNWGTTLCVVTQCSMTGYISGTEAGGICGYSAAGSSGSCAISQCSVVGNISESNAGGICGRSAGSPCTITNCYLDGPTNVIGSQGSATITKCWFSASVADDALLTNVNLSDGIVKLNDERPTLSITGSIETAYYKFTIARTETSGVAGTDFLSLGDAFTSYDHDTEASTNNVPWPSALISAPAANDPPVANALSQNVIEDTPTTITLSGTDTDGDDLTFAIVDDPIHGSVTLVGTAATYTPNLNYNGADSFTYKANDGTVDSDPATVSITVSAVNDSPEVTAVSVSLFENTSKEITLVGSDVENNTLTYTIVASPAQGTLGNVTGNKVTYTPNLNYNGADSFTYKANDGTSDSNVASCSITVTAVPVVADLFKTLDAHGHIDITLSGTNNTTSFSVTLPSNGSVNLVGSVATYTPTTDYSGTDRFTYKANNGGDSRNAIIDLMVHAANVPANEKTEITKAYDTVIAISEFNEDNSVVTWTEPTNAAKKIVWTNLTNVTRKKATRKTRAKKILQAIQAELGSTKKSFHATPAVFGIQAQASKLVVVEPQTVGKTADMSTLEANNSVTKQTIADDTVVYSPFTADEFALFKDTSAGLYRMTFTENGSNKTYTVDYRSSDGNTTETYTKVNPDDNWYPFKNLFFIFGSGSGSGEGSGGAAGDPFIQPIFGKLYEIPNIINHYRMVEGDDLIVNASYRYFTPKEKTAIRNYYYRVTGDMIGINTLVVDGGVAQNKAFIQCEGITLTYDYDTKHVCASQNVEYSIEDHVDGKGVVFTLPHSKYGKISVDCRHYINPQAYSGIFVTIQRKARECVGLLIRNYNSIPFIVNSETDTTSKKSIAKSAEHYEAPKSLLKNVIRSIK